MRPTVVAFDVGETLIDETRTWGLVADSVGVTRLTFFGVLGALVARGEQHWRVFDLLEVDPVGVPALELSDFYPDAIPCLRTLRAQGYRLGLAANQPAQTAQFLADAGLDVDFVATSAEWGVEKPAPEFFERVADAAGVDPAEIAYVGDRVDNDVLPAVRAGMLAVFVRRGPWGHLHALWPEAARAHARIDGLAELPAALRRVA